MSKKMTKPKVKKPKPAKSFIDNTVGRFERDPMTHRMRFIPPSRPKSS